MKSEAQKWKTAAVSTTNLPSIYELVEKPLEAGLWCLYVTKHKCGGDYVTFDKMETILRGFLDVPITAIRVKRAFARAGKKIIKGSGEEGYKISNPGETYLTSLKKDEPLTVVYVSPEKPRTATKTFEALIKSIPKDTLLICDPYYGLQTLDVLESIAKYHKRLKFLTAKMGGGEKATTLTRAISDFKSEYKDRIEMRVTSDRDLHDRYIIGKDRFFIIGHGIKNLGSKESLIVGIEDKYGKDIRRTLLKTFNYRWDAAKAL